MTWPQVYDPMASLVVSTLPAAVPVAVMLVALGLLHTKAYAVAVFAYGMPGDMAGRAADLGGGFHRDALAQSRGRHPALCVLSLARAGVPGGPVRDAAGLRVALLADGGPSKPTPREQTCD